MREELDQRVSGGGSLGDVLRRRARSRLARHVVPGAVVGEEARGNLAHELAVPEGAQLSTRCDLPDHGVAELPPVEHLEDRVRHLRPYERDHPLLALGDHHLPGLHPLLSERHLVEVNVDAELGRHLRERGRDPGGAAVLERLDEPGLDELERRLDQLLPREGIADLDGRALLRRLVVELLAREHGGAADPVATGRRPVQDDRLATSGCLRERQAVRGQEPDAHRVDEAVVAIGLVEESLAADGRHAHRVPVRRDAADRARELMPRLGEPQPVEKRNRPCAHRDDVAQDPADTRRGALERLDRARVVVALDLEGDRKTVAEVDDTGVLARPWSTPGPVLGRRFRSRAECL